MGLQSVIQRLPGELSEADAAAMAGPPQEAPGVPGAVIVPASGPHLDIDWGVAGAHAWFFATRSFQGS